MPDKDVGGFATSVEVVPPSGSDPTALLSTLRAVSHLPFERFSVATNPVAKPRMSALAACALIQTHIGKPATLHCTTRDHNRLSLQGLLWGARATGIDSVLAATGDFVALEERGRITSVRDVDIYTLVRMAREAGLRTGVVLDPRPESGRLAHEVQRLARKVEAGAQYVVTQPVYDEAGANALHEATQPLNIPVILGILPLRSARHARFLHHRVAGITVPESLQARMESAAQPAAEGVANARQMLDIARRQFAGACIMPAFDYYEVLAELL